MGFQLKKRERTTKVQPGTYWAKVIKIDYKENVQTKFGNQNRLYVTFRLSNGVELMQSFNAVLARESNLGKVIFNLLGDVFNDDFDTDQLLNKCCAITITHFTKENGEVFENVVDVQACEDGPGEIPNIFEE